MADALSRVAVHLNAITAVIPIWIQEVVNSYHNDTAAADLLWELAVVSPNEQGFSHCKGVIRFKDKIWIVNNSALQTKLITAFYASALGGHSGIQATRKRLKKDFHWQSMKKDVEAFVKQCEICQNAKHELCKYPGLLQPLPVPQHSWADISMDFIEGLPNSHGYSVLLVVVDKFTKYSHFLPLKHPFSATSVAQLFLDNVVKLHGVLRSIVCDIDKKFTSTF
jgi:hypothetical protein